MCKDSHQRLYKNSSHAELCFGNILVIFLLKTIRTSVALPIAFQRLLVDRTRRQSIVTVMHVNVRAPLLAFALARYRTIRLRKKWRITPQQPQVIQQQPKLHNPQTRLSTQTDSTLVLIEWYDRKSLRIEWFLYSNDTKCQTFPSVPTPSTGSPSRSLLVQSRSSLPLPPPPAATHANLLTLPPSPLSITAQTHIKPRLLLPPFNLFRFLFFFFLFLLHQVLHLF